MIYCWRGWVRVVYEDQGPPFILAAGDCVLQPPQIRHRVLESSAGAEVIEISCPALHETWADFELQLPTASVQVPREFEGQVFVHHRGADGTWAPFGDQGFESQDLGLAPASGGLAHGRLLRSGSASALPTLVSSGELMFGFVLNGAAELDYSGRHPLGPGDAFTIPPDRPWGLAACRELLLLEVRSPSARAREPAR